ncbi:multidrug efflux SMR transporter [Kribbella hippodromi]|uniref:Multidrug efflux SMR transporter n=1 Tax=Kribbella hippodromi TaxID=434347 RepID=A0ABN2DSH9_9ACTN
MAWLILVLAGILESVWATALSESKGLTRVRPALLFVVSLTLSMAGLAWAMKTLPTGTSYAVWVGIGATLTLLWGFKTGKDRATWTKSLLLVLLVGSIIGLKVVS